MAFSSVAVIALLSVALSHSHKFHARHTSPIEEDALTDNPSGAGSSSSYHAAGDGDFEFGDDDRLSGGGGNGTVDEFDLSLSDPIPRSDSSMSNSNSSSSYRTTSSIKELDLIPEEVVVYLRAIAQQMIFAGYLRECIQVYGSVRKSVVDSNFRRLGIEKLSIGDRVVGGKETSG
ncbi:hypothetical protein LINPERHAP1_LOCUS30778 [Linum perenne]